MSVTFGLTSKMLPAGCTDAGHAAVRRFTIPGMP